MIPINTVVSADQFQNNIVAFSQSLDGSDFSLYESDFSFEEFSNMKFAYIPSHWSIGCNICMRLEPFIQASVEIDHYVGRAFDDFMLKTEHTKMRFATFYELNKLQSAIQTGKAHDISLRKCNGLKDFDWEKVKELALERFKVTSMPFILGGFDEGSPISQLPQEVVAYILNS